ncbi:Nif3-like dinuclear metal center hexameric protein [Alloalcanivorax mobilis]|uniref:Nif3-like dinuclear metal center hexameric protein n=1 Tax=Alloalcanivorax mobilis TaxID=2019569 RepID=UPI000B5B29B5|nr:Nif3-like dinuclear metal center hexameric protein [Alloalcanivorax mobilis]ASK34906.1 Nif3-like dinuclear metal center hexameric protein [Alcanivorax sp. N3-2A]|tara:strand:- start:14575 stop:15333 length:759 start_codon:yes stop_codon:yes gene_type:complete
MLKRDHLLTVLDGELQTPRFRDYCPNGLQVEGRDQVRRLVTGVTACQALIDAAVVEEADAILVHHGYFWKNEDARVRGMKKQRLQSLLRHDISLFAYHLPLDAHPRLGNNAQLARRLGLRVEGGLEPDNPLSVGNIGRLEEPMSAGDFAAHVEAVLGREALHIGDTEDEIETLAWCTGAAQGFIEQAQALGVDAYLSGEISEPTTHFARETGIHYFACGHHATERYGVQAVGEWLANEYGLEHIFIDIDNPV